MASGVYEIVNLINGKRYVGSSGRIDSRIKEHFFDLRGNSHKNAPLQQDWNEYGETAFEFLVILTCHPKELIFKEQEQIDGYDFDYLYNTHPTAGSPLGFKHSTAGSPLGFKHSEESKAKMSASRKGRAVSHEARARLLIANSNPSLERREKKFQRH
jgi:group I intron endonuclease